MRPRWGGGRACREWPTAGTAGRGGLEHRDTGHEMRACRFVAAGPVCAKERLAARVATGGVKKVE